MAVRSKVDKEATLAQFAEEPKWNKSEVGEAISDYGAGHSSSELAELVYAADYYGLDSRVLALALEATRKAELEAAKPAPEVEVLAEVGGVTVEQDNRPRFATLDDALHNLALTISKGETLRVQAARIVQAIDDQRLWVGQQIDGKEVKSFRQFLPALLDWTAGLGWSSERTITNYLWFVNVYLDRLELPEKPALTAVSHLGLLQRVATTERGEYDLLEDAAEGKLGADDFEAVVRVINGLVNAPDGFKEPGLPPETAATYLRDNGLADELAAFEQAVGFAPVFAEGAGWPVSKTKEVIAAITAKDEEETRKVQRVWYVDDNGDGTVTVKALSIEVVDGPVLETFELSKVVSAADFDEMTASDSVVGRKGDEDGE